LKISALLFFVLSLSAIADVCICQYPKQDARYGAGFKGEIGFYKMGCGAWLLSQTKCRKEKIIDINETLEPYLNERLRSNEKIRIGFVGHWSSSDELVDYLDNDIVPLMQKYNSPIEVDNTACDGMNDPQSVQDYLATLKTQKDSYLSVQGSQTTSIGMWDKLSISFRKADLIAYADTRGNRDIYPKCEIFHKKRCTGFQYREVGKCTDSEGVTKELICHGTIKKKKNGNYKLKKKKRWLYLDNIIKLSREVRLY
jgi:hypothetical protein